MRYKPWLLQGLKWRAPETIQQIRSPSFAGVTERTDGSVDVWKGAQFTKEYYLNLSELKAWTAKERKQNVVELVRKGR